MDAKLFVSLWIKRNEGRAAWLNWLTFQHTEPADDEQERGAFISQWFIDLEVESD